MTIQLEDVGLVSWDIDGTMYSLHKVRSQLRRMFLKRILTGHAPSACREMLLMRRHRNEIEKARKEAGCIVRPANGDVREVEKRWYEPAIGKSGPAKGVAEMISLLNSQGIPQVVVSDYEAHYKLKSLLIRDQFAAVYVGEELGFVKPSPKLFEVVAADFKLPSNRILHLGDRIDTDEAAARSAGCQCLILGRDFSSFDVLLDELQSKPTHGDRTVGT